ncbi:hypothetical protein KA183_09680 [bacterium]|nr:hypothetical protein [bacterium]QQR58618.1 MAG: hypothetical protein IPG59_03725 [Candidatus Melainabacteria bacterium]
MKIKLAFAALSLTFAFNSNWQPAWADEALPGFKADELPAEPKGEVQIPMNRPTLIPVADELQTTSDLPPEPEIIVRDGPLTDARSDLLRSIYKAKECGIGITSYMKAFECIEDMAAKSEPEDAIQKRIDSLKVGLDEQLKRSEGLKTETGASAAHQGPGGGRKLGPGNLLADPQAIPSSFRTMGGGAGGQSSELLDMIISQKLGGKLPSQMSKQELQKKMKEVPELEEYLKRFNK